MIEKDKKNVEILPAKNQLKLFGYNKYFNLFIKLYESGKLPNTILLSGIKGSGKSTFAYHFINYLFSVDRSHKYSIDNFTIEENNSNYLNICNCTHPNFFLLDNISDEENIKIENTRKLIKFLSKSTFSSDIKFILIDNAEYLNIHSSNSLLKALEESNNKTFFIIIHNSSSKILNTIKSRSVEFKFFFSIAEKRKILEKLSKNYIENFDINKIDDSLFFDSPGNILKYLLILDPNNFDLLNDKRSCILHLIEKYNKIRNPEILSFFSILIELYYNELSVKNHTNLEFYSMERNKILNMINDTKKFNLDKKNLLTTVRATITND